MGTDVLTNRKRTSFRLSEDLLHRLTTEAKRENKSLNNYVENTLMDAVAWKPNRETLAAIEEAKAGKFAGTIDMTNFDTFMKSIDDIE
ncbi:MAG: toxin-antitoxin system HicB family antitoxin [Tannerella sp.]|jgi:predicted transcriptional regulator|nr:toxin-antitoxin system HicB family antitoxin [Tannerella sp.]